VYNGPGSTSPWTASGRSPCPAQGPAATAGSTSATGTMEGNRR
jgi:hypothetical protein